MYHKANLNRIIADYTGQPLAKIEEDTDRDRYMSPLEAKDYGLIDHIVGGEEAVYNSRSIIAGVPKVRGFGKLHDSAQRIYIKGVFERAGWDQLPSAIP